MKEANVVNYSPRISTRWWEVAAERDTSSRRQGRLLKFRDNPSGRKLDGKIVAGIATLSAPRQGMEMRRPPCAPGRRRVQSAACRRPAANPDLINETTYETPD